MSRCQLRRREARESLTRRKKWDHAAFASTVSVEYDSVRSIMELLNRLEEKSQNTTNKPQKLNPTGTHFDLSKPEEAQVSFLTLQGLLLLLMLTLSLR